MSDPIRCEGVTLGYDGRIIVEDVDLVVKERDFLAIIGPNGGGKSTLLKGMLGLLKPMSGSITIYGEPPRTGRRHIGYIPQYSHFDTRYPIRVSDVVLMGTRRTKGLRPGYTDEDREAAESALKMVDMEGFADRQVSELSGGQTQRVFLARALVDCPDILLLDEPTANVDRETGGDIYEKLSSLNRRMTIVLVTHDIGVISRYVKRVACLNRTIVCHDEPLITKEMLEDAYSCPVDLIAHGVPHRMFREH